MKKVKSIIFGMIAGANVVTIIVMLMLGFADHINPVSHPSISGLGMFFPFAALANLFFLFLWLTIKWRMAWIPFVGFLLAYAPMRTYMPFNLPSSPPKDAIKIISYNIAGYASAADSADGFKLITEYIRDQKPDIFCTQEDNDTKPRTDEFYESTFPYNDTYKINESDKVINRVGIHTRYPILRTERISYSSVSNGSIAWYLKVGNDTLIVINNHLEATHLTKDDRHQYRQIVHGDMESDTARAEYKRLLAKLADASTKRAPAADSIHRYIQAHSNYPIVVCGDFNDHPLSYTRRVIAKNMTDCFVSTGNGIGRSFNRYGMYFRIDHLICSKNIQPFQCKIDSKNTASDHYPVVCWLKIGRNP